MINSPYKRNNIKISCSHDTGRKETRKSSVLGQEGKRDRRSEKDMDASVPTPAHGKTLWIKGVFPIIVCPAFLNQCYLF